MTLAVTLALKSALVNISYDVSCVSANGSTNVSISANASCDVSIDASICVDVSCDVSAC